mmetsp:Transcript_142859/g.259407  ORF Transcript_142859/g.259407 Transcript_142859/m.259407 type:complete len:213 (+) Transcript_142859:1210-1848(+)
MLCHSSCSCSKLAAADSPSLSYRMPRSSHWEQSDCVGAGPGSSPSASEGDAGPEANQGSSVPKACSSLQISIPVGELDAACSGLSGNRHSSMPAGSALATRRTRTTSRTAHRPTSSCSPKPSATANAKGTCPAASCASKRALPSRSSRAISAELSLPGLAAQMCSRVRPFTSVASSAAPALSPRETNAALTESTSCAFTAALSDSGFRLGAG